MTTCRTNLRAIGQLLVLGEIGAHEARYVVDGAADLPALNDLLDGGKTAFKLALLRLLLQDDLRKYVDRLRELAEFQQGV